MKVLAVINYQKLVVVEIPEPVEPDTDQGRKPDFEARNKVIALAEEAAKNVELEWTYSDYFQEAKNGNDGMGWEVDGVQFEGDEWFDI